MTNPVFIAASARNRILKEDLAWSFGGRQQKGWYLYIPLICHLIGTDQGVETPQFAQELSEWQRSVRLAPSGVLDEGTWHKMVQVFQSHRLKSFEPASADDLVEVPSANFFDPARPADGRKVERQTYQAYKKLVEAALGEPSLHLAALNKTTLRASENRLKIISGYRTQEYQDALRAKSPDAGTAGLAKISPHITGHALDLYVGGEPVNTQDTNRAIQVQSDLYQWLVRNAGRFGFRPYFYEPWHWEYRGE